MTFTRIFIHVVFVIVLGFNCLFIVFYHLSLYIVYGLFMFTVLCSLMSVRSKADMCFSVSIIIIIFFVSIIIVIISSSEVFCEDQTYFE